jgi:hypothetical protein
MKIYVLYDKIMDINSLMCFRNKYVAGTSLKKYIENSDYHDEQFFRLCEVGSFDEDSGKIDLYEERRLITWEEINHLPE